MRRGVDRLDVGPAGEGVGAGRAVAVGDHTFDLAFAGGATHRPFTWPDGQDQRFRSDLGLYVHLHCLITDGAFEEAGADVRFLPAATPTPERMTAVLAQVHKSVGGAAEGADIDMDPALAACVQLAFSGPHLAQDPV